MNWMVSRSIHSIWRAVGSAGPAAAAAEAPAQTAAIATTLIGDWESEQGRCTLYGHPQYVAQPRPYSTLHPRSTGAAHRAGVVKDLFRAPPRALRRTCGGRSAHVRLHAVLDFLRPVWENSTILTDPLFGGNLLVKFRADRIGNQYLT